MFRLSLLCKRLRLLFTQRCLFLLYVWCRRSRQSLTSWRWRMNKGMRSFNWARHRWLMWLASVTATRTLSSPMRFRRRKTLQGTPPTVWCHFKGSYTQQDPGQNEKSGSYCNKNWKLLSLFPGTYLISGLFVVSIKEFSHGKIWHLS